MTGVHPLKLYLLLLWRLLASVYARNPVRCNALAVSGVLAAAAHYGVVLPKGSVVVVVTMVLPVLLAGEHARRQVTPSG